MLKQKTVFLFAVFVFWGVFLCGCGDGSGGDAGILRAVPNGAGVIVEIPDLEKFMQTLNNNSVMWTEIRRLKSFSDADRVMRTVDSSVRCSAPLRGILHGREAVLSFHKIGKDRISMLAAVQLSREDGNNLANAVAASAKDRNLKLSTQKYDNVKIYALSAENGGGGAVLYFAYLKNFFVISQSQMLLQESVRHVNKDGSFIEKDNSLKRIFKGFSTDADAGVIVNYKCLNDIVGNEFNPKVYASGVGKFAQWSAFDMRLESKNVMLSGFTVCEDRNLDYLGVFRRQKETSDGFLSYLPSKTVSFVSAGISDMRLFRDSYISDYLKSRGGYAEFEKNDAFYSKEYEVDMRDEIYRLFKKRITEFTCDYSLAGRGCDSYTVAELEDTDAAEFMISVVRKYQKKNGLPDSKVLTDIKSVSGRKYVVYMWPLKKIFPLYFGSLFSVESDCFVLYDGKVVFAKNAAAVREYVNAVENGKTLNKNENYSGFADLTRSESNVFCFLDFPYAFEKVLSYMSPQNQAVLKSDRRSLKRFRNCAVQYGSADDDIYLTTVSAQYTDFTEAERAVSWIAPVDSSLRCKPQIVKNHSTGDREVIVQDETCKIYLFDKNGRQLWKKQLPGPLTGEVSQIDCFQNGKLQYLFATENFLHLIDRNGNYVENFPVKLPAPLTADISVFDYENSGAYRIFAPCADRRLYVYTREGALLDAWVPFETRDPVITPVKYFNVGSVEYLVFADKLKTYILNRRGEVRIRVTDDFPKSGNSLFYLEERAEGGTRFVTTGSSGEIKYIRMDGSCKTEKIKHYSAGHNFVAADLDLDGKNEYVFTDDNLLEAFDSGGRLVFSVITDGKITSRPLIFSFSGGKRIGVVCGRENKIYLYDNKGRLCSGFPLSGSTEFTLTLLDSRDRYSLLTGSNENFLYNYHVQ